MLFIATAYFNVFVGATSEYSPFEKGGRGDLKILTVATILNPPHSPFFKGGGFKQAPNPLKGAKD